ncbi:MAG: hypothetical protein M0Z50_09855 [Planctomycetia bacterium]|jgi:hypothetical protein|nr:hypothetical protein [Planctomycetia bacterium]
MSKSTKKMTILEKTSQPSIPVEVSPGVYLTRTQIWKRVKAVIKEHPRFNGSGHLLLKDPDNKIKTEEAKAFIQYVHDELMKQGIDDTNARIDTMVKSCLPRLTKRTDWHHQINFAERAKVRKQMEKEAQREAQKMQALQHPSQSPSQQPTLTLKSNPRTETRQITVTIKKARTFHYPLDLPDGTDK